MTPKQGRKLRLRYFSRRSDNQKQILIYLIEHPTYSVKACSEAIGASVKSIRYTFKKAEPWLDIRHEGADKTGRWIFSLK